VIKASKKVICYFLVLPRGPVFEIVEHAKAKKMKRPLWGTGACIDLGVMTRHLSATISPLRTLLRFY
jgi:hypothetical protein